MEEPVILQRRPLPSSKPDPLPIKHRSIHRDNSKKQMQSKDPLGVSNEKVYYYVMNGPSLFPYRVPRTLPKIKRHAPDNRCGEDVFGVNDEFSHESSKEMNENGHYFVDDSINGSNNGRNIYSSKFNRKNVPHNKFESVSYNNLPGENPDVPEYVCVKPWRLQLLEQQQRQHECQQRQQLECQHQQQKQCCVPFEQHDDCPMDDAAPPCLDCACPSASGKYSDDVSNNQVERTGGGIDPRYSNEESQRSRTEEENMELDCFLAETVSSGGTEMNLKGYFLESFPEIWPSFYSTLTSVDISYNNLKEVPQKLCAIHSLQSLNLQNNPITVLPKEMKQLKQLTSLNVSHCLLDKLGQNVCSLTSLVLLDMSYNFISSVHQDISQLVHLETLNLDGNTITAFPHSILQLTNMKTLQCNLNFTHKLFWRESCPPGPPQRLFDATLLMMLRDERLSHAVPERFGSCVGLEHCACCAGEVVGEGVNVLKPVAHVFGVKHLPLLFRVCSHTCRVDLQRSEVSPYPA